MHRLPFFEDRHRSLAERFDAFARVHLDPLAEQDETRTDATARDYVRRLAEGGWLGWIDPVDIRAVCLLRDRTAYGSALADTMLAMQGLGGIPIAIFGDAAQRGAWLTRITRGAIAAFALTEPGAGSDPAGMTLRAVREGGVYRLTGEKTFISNAGLAEVYVLFARTAEGDSSAHTAFIVPGDAPGLSVEPIEMIAPHPIGSVRLRDVRIPESLRLGSEGDGLRIALATLDRFRCTVGAAACGMARRALDDATAHVRQRVQFGRPLAKFQGVQFMLADMATELDAAQLLVARAAWQVDGEARGAGGTGGLGAPGWSADPAVKRAASTAKLFATDHGHAIIGRALQLLGGGGLVRGSRVERLYREVRALRIYEGASEIQRLVIARTLLGERERPLRRE